MALEDLKNLLKKEGKAEKKADLAVVKREKEIFEQEDVEKIVKKIQKKYAEQGIIKERATGQMGALRGIITSETGVKDIKIEDTSVVLKSKDPLVRSLGGFYARFESQLQQVPLFLSRLPRANDLEFSLYSANMPYSASQFLTIASTGVVLYTLVATLFAALLLQFYFYLNPGNYNPILYLLLFVVPLLSFLFASLFALRIPSIVASNRAKEIEKELPFALRHMATQIKSGTSLHRTMQTLATTDYGAFSEEIARTLREMDEGLSTEAALENLKTRTSSKVLRRVILHLLRALRTGGQLSEVLASIAEQVADDLLVKIREFAEKINFIGVIYIVGCIVGPVLVAVLGGIRNAPLGAAGGSESLFAAIPLTIPVLTIIYVLLFPMVLFFITMVVKASEPIGV